MTTLPCTTLALSFPTVHLNGTSGDVLLRQFKDARLALRQAVDALQCAAPNARDYYVQPGGVSAAQREHEARIAKLREVEEEVYALMQGVQDQIAARVRR